MIFYKYYMTREYYPHNPYGPDWPDANFHPDWPHYRHMHGWNDTEPASVVPWPEECCPQPGDDCMCVTSGDVLMWNTISAVSAFADIDIRGLSGLSALSGLDSLIPATDLVKAHSGIWMSAAEVPAIYQDIYSLSAKVDTKAPLSGEYLQQVYSDPYFFDGKGTMKSVLRPSQDLKDTVAMVYESSDVFTKKLVNEEELAEKCGPVMASIDELNRRTVDNANSIALLNEKIKDLTPGGGGKSTDWKEQKVTAEESKNHPDVFYYFDSQSIN